MKKYFVSILILLSVLLTACAKKASAAPTPEPLIVVNSLVIAEGKLIPNPSVELAFSQPGIIAEILVKEGDRVKEGQVIARLENSEAMQAEVARAEETFLLAEQSFNLSQADALKRLADANEAVRTTQNNLDNFDIPTDLKPMGPEESARHTYEKLEKARADYEPYKYKNRRKDIDDNHTDCKIKNGIETCKDTAKYYEKKLNDAWADYRKAIQWLEREAALQAAKAELENKQKEFDNLTAGENSETMAIARAQFETARANLEAARAALANVQLRAPITATILSLDISVGETVNAGLPVAFLGNTNQWQVETKDLAEVDVASVSIGDPVSIKLDAFPNEEFSGTVTKIDPVGREYLGDMTYKTTIALAEPDPRFFWNMTATVTITVE